MIAAKRCGKQLLEKREVKRDGLGARGVFCLSLQHCHFEQSKPLKIVTFACEWFIVLLIESPGHHCDNYSFDGLTSSAWSSSLS